MKEERYECLQYEFDPICTSKEAIYSQGNPIGHAIVDRYTIYVI
jgi:hypothetical protein